MAIPKIFSGVHESDSGVPLNTISLGGRGSKYQKDPEENLMMFWDSFDEKICLTLKTTPERKKAAEAEFKKVNLSDVDFFYGCLPGDEIVKNAFREGKVHAFPSCWRCGEDKCGCENNILVPAQIACFMSYVKIFEHAANSDSYTFLIMEDDIEFESYCNEVGEQVFQRDKLEAMHFYSEFPCLLSLGQNYFGKGHIGTRHYNNNIRWADGDLSECNVMFAFNKPYAKLALRFLKKFTMTSDIYIHNFLGTRCVHWSLFPRLSHDKSWSLGTVKSTIHPKQVLVDNKNLPMKMRLAEKQRMVKHTKRVESEAQYNKYIQDYLKDP